MSRTGELRTPRNRAATGGSGDTVVGAPTAGSGDAPDGAATAGWGDGAKVDTAVLLEVGRDRTRDHRRSPRAQAGYTTVARRTRSTTHTVRDPFPDVEFVRRTNKLG